MKYTIYKIENGKCTYFNNLGNWATSEKYAHPITGKTTVALMVELLRSKYPDCKIDFSEK